LNWLQSARLADQPETVSTIKIFVEGFDDYQSMSNMPQSVPSEAFKAKKLHQNVRDCFVKKHIRKTSRSEKNYP